FQGQLLRAGPRVAGWTSNHGAFLQHARAIRVDTSLLDNAAAALAGTDMRPLRWSKAPGSSIAFGGDGQVLFGGLTNSPAHLWNPKSGQFEELPANGDGPVGFDAEDVALQFVAVSEGRFALGDARAGVARREFGLAGEPTTGAEGRPALAMSPDCSKVAAAVRTAGGGQFAVWDGVTGERLGQSNEFVTALAFSPDGTLLAT